VLGKPEPPIGQEHVIVPSKLSQLERLKTRGERETARKNSAGSQKTAVSNTKIKRETHSRLKEIKEEEIEDGMDDDEAQDPTLLESTETQDFTPAKKSRKRALKSEGEETQLAPPKSKKSRSGPKPIVVLDTSHLNPQDILNVADDNDLVNNSKAISLQGVRFDDMIPPPTKGQIITVRKETTSQAGRRERL
jgi:hypothetical protein